MSQFVPSPYNGQYIPNQAPNNMFNSNNNNTYAAPSQQSQQYDADLDTNWRPPPPKYSQQYHADHDTNWRPPPPQQFQQQQSQPQCCGQGQQYTPQSIDQSNLAPPNFNQPGAPGAAAFTNEIGVPVAEAFRFQPNESPAEWLARAAQITNNHGYDFWVQGHHFIPSLQYVPDRIDRLSSISRDEVKDLIIEALNDFKQTEALKQTVNTTRSKRPKNKNTFSAKTLINGLQAQVTYNHEEIQGRLGPNNICDPKVVQWTIDTIIQLQHEFQQLKEQLMQEDQQPDDQLQQFSTQLADMQQFINMMWRR